MSVFYKLIITLSICISVCSCDFEKPDSTKRESKRKNSKKRKINNPGYDTSTAPVNYSPQEQEFEIGYINFDQLPQYLQNQIEGAGCGFSLSPNGNDIMVNGLIRVNGLYELLEENSDAEDENKMIYENERWELRFILNDKSRMEEGSTFPATMMLRNKKTNQIMSKKVYGACGC